MVEITTISQYKTFNNSHSVTSFSVLNPYTSLMYSLSALQHETFSYSILKMPPSECQMTRFSDTPGTICTTQYQVASTSIWRFMKQPSSSPEYHCHQSLNHLQEGISTCKLSFYCRCKSFILFIVLTSDVLIDSWSGITLQLLVRDISRYLSWYSLGW